MVVARNARIYVDSIGDIVLRRGGIVSSGIQLSSRALHYLQQHLLGSRLEKLSSDCVGFR